MRLDACFYPIKMYVEFHSPYESPKDGELVLLASRTNFGTIGYGIACYGENPSGMGSFHMRGYPPITAETPFFIGWMRLSELDTFVENIRPFWMTTETYEQLKMLR